MRTSLLISSLLISSLLLAAQAANAQLSLSLGAESALPGERIPVSCSLTISEDYKPNRVTVLPYLITGDGDRISKGGIRGSDGGRSAGGYLAYTRDELVRGDCGLAYAPLVPGQYEYEVTVSSYERPDEKPFVLSLTVDSLPAAPEALAFTRNSIDPHYGTRMAGYRFVVPEDRCYPESLNPRTTHIAVIDVSTGRVASSSTPGAHLNYEGSSTTIDQYNCLPAGVINDRIRAPSANAPGDWHLALTIADDKEPICLGDCDEAGAFNNAGHRVIALTPIDATPAESADSELYFERMTDSGPRRAGEAAIGDRVRLVLEDPQASSERQIAITAGNETRMVDLVPDGHRLVSEIFVLGLSEE
jgi:hypothetical protein